MADISKKYISTEYADAVFGEKINTLTAENSSLSSAVTEKTEENETLRAEKETLTEEKKTLTDSNTSLTQERDSLKEANTTLSDRNKQLTDSNATLSAQLTETASQVDNLEKTIETLKKTAGGDATQYAANDYYLNNYKGDMEDGDELTRMLKRASDIIDRATFGRIGKIGYDNLTEYQLNKLRRATCLEADYLHIYGGFIYSPVGSYSIGATSINLGSGTRGRPEELTPEALHLLDDTGLTCRIL